MSPAVCLSWHLKSVSVVDTKRRYANPGPWGSDVVPPSCGDCGLPIITECIECGAPIPRPDYYIESPSFCVNCSAPHPWATQEQRVNQAKGLLALGVLEPSGKAGQAQGGPARD